MVVTVFFIGMHWPTKSTFERACRLNLLSLGASRHFMSCNPTSHTNIFQECPVCSCHHFLSELKVNRLEDLGVIHIASTALLTESIHIIPTQSSCDVFKTTVATLNTESHIEVRAAFVDMLPWAMLSLHYFLCTFSQTPFVKKLQTLVSWLKLHF